MLRQETETRELANFEHVIEEEDNEDSGGQEEKLNQNDSVGGPNKRRFSSEAQSRLSRLSKTLRSNTQTSSFKQEEISEKEPSERKIKLPSLTFNNRRRKKRNTTLIYSIKQKEEILKEKKRKEKRKISRLRKRSMSIRDSKTKEKSPRRSSKEILNKRFTTLPVNKQQSLNLNFNEATPKNMKDISVSALRQSSGVPRNPFERIKQVASDIIATQNLSHNLRRMLSFKSRSIQKGRTLEDIAFLREKDYYHAFHGKNIFWYFWDCFLLLSFLLQLYYFVMIPRFEMWFEMIHLLFVFDIFFNFFRGTLQKNDFENNRLSRVAKRYLRAWFWVDLSGFLPLLFPHGFKFLFIGVLRIFTTFRCISTIERGVGSSFKRIYRSGSDIITGKIMGKMIKILVIGYILGHILSLLVVKLDFKFLHEIEAQKAIYTSSWFFLITTTTTVGYTQDKSMPENFVNVMLSILLQLCGIMLNGFIFKQFVEILKLYRTFKQTFARKYDDFNHWVVLREKFIQSARGRALLTLTQGTFEFYWHWDIANIFGGEFFSKLGSRTKDRLEVGSIDWVKMKFSAFFKAVKDQKVGDELFHLMRPAL